MMTFNSPNFGDSQNPKTLLRVFQEHGVEPPADCKNVDYSDTDDDDQSVDSEDDEEEEPEQMLKMPLSSVNLEQIPGTIRAVVEESKTSTTQQFLASSLMVALNLMALAFVEVIRSVAGTMMAHTNHMFDIFPENFRRSARNAGRIFSRILKYSIMCSFVVRSIKYFYLNVYLEENI